VIRLLDLVAVGRAGVDFYSLDLGAPLEAAKKFAKYVGGTTANSVVGASRLGLKTALVSGVGDDALGRFVLKFLSEEGVDITHIKKDAKRKTGVVFAEVSPGKDGEFVFYRENVADLEVTESDVPGSLLKQARALLVTGTGLSKEPSLGTVLSAARRARKLGKEVVFNLDWRPSLWSVSERSRTARYAKMAERSDILIGNQGEYTAATGTDSLEEATRKLRGGRSKTMVVTRGERGSTVLSPGGRHDAPGFEVPLLKGLGGGDGFIAGFLYGHLSGWGDIESAIFGNAVGAIVVTGHACSESMPRLVEVEEFLTKRGYGLDKGSGPFKR
jgi:5-dehydro-2-deoxygluconokinase